MSLIHRETKFMRDVDKARAGVNHVNERYLFRQAMCYHWPDKYTGPSYIPQREITEAVVTGAKYYNQETTDYVSKVAEKQRNRIAFTTALIAHSREIGEALRVTNNLLKKYVRGSNKK